MTNKLDPALRLKSFFAPTVEIAVARVRAELGPDALIVDSRPAPPEATHLGRCEVVAAVGAPVAAKSEAPQPSSSRAEPDLMASLGRISVQLGELSTIVRRSHSLPAYSTQTLEALTLLAERGLGRDTAEEIVRAVAERLSQRAGGEGDSGARRFSLSAGPAPAIASPNPAFRAELKAELESRVRVLARLGNDSAARRIVALVGPPGAGKTTTIVKLAFHYGIRVGVPVQLLSLDTVRIAGTEQLRACAAIMGVGCQALGAPVALPQALAEHRTKTLVLIDTPGLSASDFGDAAEIAAVLRREEVDTHLVLPASMAAAPMYRCTERFDVFRPNKLIFTKLDEMEECGGCYDIAVKTGTPVSYLSTGPCLPEDLTEASREWFTGSLFRNWPEPALSAA